MTESVHPWEGNCQEREDKENGINIHICVKYINNYNAITLLDIWIVPVSSHRHGNGDPSLSMIQGSNAISSNISFRSPRNKFPACKDKQRRVSTC